MKIVITSRFDKSPLFTTEDVSVSAALEAAVRRHVPLYGAYLSGLDLRRTDLCEADLRDSDLRDADLRGAVMHGADLARVDLRWANLEEADLSGADLYEADLRGVNLRAANLRRANLFGAKLSDAFLDGIDLAGADLRQTGLISMRTMAEYLSEFVPALCRAGGHTLEEVSAGWTCHTWKHCPMAIAFDVDQLQDIPVLYRAAAEQFIRLFDAGLIPNPCASK